MSALSLFTGLGVELEIMLVNSETLNPQAQVAELFQSMTGTPCSDVELGEVSWSNELVSHVLEIKNPKPVSHLNELYFNYQKSIESAWKQAEGLGGQLLGAAMHPWMDPVTETKLWSLGTSNVYAKYNELFDCSSHGWANVQATHLNIAFATDSEFSRLHSAARMVLPLIPALCASSPYYGGQRGAWLTNRLEFYFLNQKRVASIIGEGVPEVVHSRQEYEDKILSPIYKDLANLDPEGVLRHEWVNSRGAIPKFSRDSLEIRLMDSQECVAADISLCAFFLELLRHLTLGGWHPIPMAQKNQDLVSSTDLKQILMAVAKSGGETIIDHKAYLEVFGCYNPRIKAKDLLSYIKSELDFSGYHEEIQDTLSRLLRRGSLAETLVKICGNNPTRESLKEVYTQVSKCLLYNKLFSPFV